MFESTRRNYIESRNEIYLYVEKFDRRNGIILLDFVDSNEFALFEFLSAFNYPWEKRPTMLEISNYFQRRITEGSVYVISKEVLLILIERIVIAEDSFIVGFRLKLIESDPEIFRKSKSFSWNEKFERNIDQSNIQSLELLIENENPSEEVVVRNVGQGSWNEVYDSRKKCVLIFDLGTIYTTSRADLISMIGNRDFIYQQDAPMLILSHWDVDHYHFLLGLKDDTIKSFSLFIYRGIIPNLTARKAIGRFQSLGSTILKAMPAEDPPYPRRSSDILKSYNLSSSKEVLAFNGSQNRSRNKSGIALAIRTKTSSILFAADLNFDQVSKFILPTLGYACDHYLVVPHHGGNAGKVIYNTHSLNNLKNAIISVGANPYRPPHPFAKNISELTKLGFKVQRTDSIGSDIAIKIK